jgi:hypothetical protein
MPGRHRRCIAIIDLSFLIIVFVESIFILAIAQSLISHKCGPRNNEWDNGLPRCQVNGTKPTRCTDNGDCKISDMNAYEKRGGYHRGVILLIISTSIEIMALVFTSIISCMYIILTSSREFKNFRELRVHYMTKILFAPALIGCSVIITGLVYLIREIIHLITQDTEKIDDQRFLEAWGWIMLCYIFGILFHSLSLNDIKNDSERREAEQADISVFSFKQF